MTVRRMTPQPLEQTREETEYAEDMAELAMLLLDILEVPEIRERVRHALGITSEPQRAAPQATPPRRRR